MDENDLRRISADIITTCPWCLSTLEAAAPLSDADTPHDGAVNICAECGLISVFELILPSRLRKPTPDERESILADPEVQWILRQWIVMDETRKARQR